MPTAGVPVDRALAAIPPDIQITLARGSSDRMAPLSDRGKTLLTSLIVVAAIGTDALFFPYVKYMVTYGIFVCLPSGVAIWRLWNRRSVKR